MNTAKVKTYTPEQLANGNHGGERFHGGHESPGAFSHQPCRGMKAQERFPTSRAGA